MRVHTVICNHDAIIATMREHGNISPRIRRAALTAVDNPDLAWIRNRVDTLQPGNWTALVGVPGTGKTFALHYAWVALDHAGITDRLTDAKMVLAADVMYDAFHGGHEHLASRDYTALMIDDFGAEFESSKSDWTAAQWDRLFNLSYQQMQYVWISTNLSDADIRARYGERVWSRLADQRPGWMRTFRTKFRGTAQEAEHD